MSDELSEEFSKAQLTDLTVQLQHTSDVPGSSTNIENCVSGKVPEQNMELTDKGQHCTVDPQEGPSKLGNSEYFSSREAESKLEVTGKEFSAEEKESHDSSMAKQINTEIIKFIKYPTALDKFPDMTEVYNVTTEALNRHIHTLQIQARLLQEHEEILRTVPLSNMSSESIKVIQNLKAKTELDNQNALRVQILFQTLANIPEQQEAKEVYLDFAGRLEDLANFANFRKGSAMDCAMICRGHAEAYNEFSQNLSEKADIHEAHAEVFDELKSIFQKYEDLCLARAESL